MTLIISDEKKLRYCQKAIELKQNIEISYLKLGEMLYNIKEGKLYEPNWSSFHEYCMEFKLPSSTVSKVLNIYRVFVLEYGFPEKEIIMVGWTSLAETLPQIKNKEDAIRWFGTATTLSRQDLKKELVEAKTGVLMRNCKHRDTYTMRICRDCGDKWQDEDSLKDDAKKD